MPGVIMGYGWKGGMCDGDVGETLKFVGSQIKLGAREVARDLARGLRSLGKTIARRRLRNSLKDKDEGNKSDEGVGVEAEKRKSGDEDEIVKISFSSEKDILTISINNNFK